MRRKNQRPQRGNRQRKLRVETLEHRRVLASYFVDAAASGGGDGSADQPFNTIQAAVAVAQQNPGADEIQVAPGQYQGQVAIADNDGLSLRGSDPAQPPVLVAGQPLKVVLPSATFVFENLVLRSTEHAAFIVDTHNRPGERAGSIRIAGVDIEAPQAQAISAVGLSSLQLQRVSASRGQVFLKDIDSVEINSLTVTDPAATALVANRVSSLEVDGMTATNPGYNGVLVRNDVPSGSFRTPPVSATLRDIHVTDAGRHGISFHPGVALSVHDSTIQSSRSVGILLFNPDRIDNPHPVTLENVQLTNNDSGIYLSRSGPVQLTDVRADGNGYRGMHSDNAASVTINKGSFSGNQNYGLQLYATSGVIDIRSVSTSDNGAIGMSIINNRDDVELHDIVADGNTAQGILVNVPRLSSFQEQPNVVLHGAAARGNWFSGITIANTADVHVQDVIASSNGHQGLLIQDPVGEVSVSDSIFNNNASVVGVDDPHGAFIRNPLGHVTLDTILANGNPKDGVQVRNPRADVSVTELTAMGNVFSGLAVVNVDTPQVTHLTVRDSNLSGNGQNGLFASWQSGVQITGSRFDSNGPAAGEDGPNAHGVWLIGTGSGNILVEDSTAIGTRLGTNRGAGMNFASLRGAVTTIRNVRITDTAVHPATTTGIGAGISVTGSSPGVTIEDSQFENNRLTDDQFTRSVIYTTSPLTVRRSQLLGNDGKGIDGTGEVSIYDSTVANNRSGAAVLMERGSIVNSTLSGNEHFAVFSRRSLNLTDVTITNNQGDRVIQNFGQVSLSNSIVAGNLRTAPLFNNFTAVVSLGHNLLGGMTPRWSAQSTDIVGDMRNPLDPKLAPLADNGGPTLTHMPLLDSPALEAGDPRHRFGLDQRGRQRPIAAYGDGNARVDIGAVEADVLNTAPAITLDTTTVVGSEGSTWTLSGRVVDAEDNLTSFKIDDQLVQLDAEGNFTWTGIAEDDGQLVLNLIATDHFGLATATEVPVQIGNLPPQLDQVDVQINPADRVATLTAAVSDAGVLDTHTVTIDWGDGTIETVDVADDGSVQATHTYNRPDVVTVDVLATDNAGDSSETTTVTVLVSGIHFESGQLTVIGTEQADTVVLKRGRRKTIEVNAILGQHSESLTIDARQLDSVFARLDGGDDHWDGGDVDADQMIFGDSGDDTLITGGGDDIVVGGDGLDDIRTQRGDDMLLGGRDSDRLDGGHGDDILVGGHYVRQHEQDSLAALHAVWTGRGKQAAKVDMLKSGVGTDDQGEVMRLDMDLVSDDAADQLLSSQGSDWWVGNDPAESQPQKQKGGKRKR